jgi:large repetitive protein
MEEKIMNERRTHNKRNRRQRHLFFQQLAYVLALLILPFLMTDTVLGASLRVLGVGKDGTTSRLSEYRWLIEEDTTYHVVPGTQDPNTLAVRFHASYMPVVAEGDNSVALPDLDPAKRYHVSVIPKIPGTFTIGGASLVGNGLVTVYVNELPLPTAQISIFVFQDLNPINNALDAGEPGLEGFRIKLEDAGGRYGISAGEQLADAYGNFLGTVYVMTCDESGQNPGSGINACLDAEGTPIVATDGGGNPIVEPLITPADGSLTIKNLAPGKYGIIAIPPNAIEDPPGSGNFVGTNWVQTSTIEGTKVIDAWVKANEPPFFQEFGVPGPHVGIGFVPAGPNRPFVDATALSGGATVSGQIVNLHLSRPPATAFHAGEPFPHTTAWVGLNLGAAGLGRGVYAARTNDDGTFAIPDVPNGDYQLVVWDDNMDIIFAFHGLTVTGGALDLGAVPVFQWFARTEHWIYNDLNENGLRDAGEPGLLEQAVNIRWRDGSVYQSFPTDSTGFAPFDQIFPFFAWLVAEVDFARFKATGLTLTIDDGGPIDTGDPWSWEGVLTPQAQDNPIDPDSDVVTNKYRTELGPVLTQGFQAFLGQTHVFQWGKKAYGPDENGGISGIVFYGVTRAEDNPEMAAAEPWEPGIPRVEVNLYAYDATQPDLKGALLNSTVTDSWDDSPPADCQYGSNAGSGTDDPFVFRGVATDCYDGLRNWNQVRPGVFDGGYAFDSIFDPQTLNEISPIPAARYIVEVVPPTGYKVIQSQDKNVDFGENYLPSTQLLPPECVGTPYVVPDELTLFPGVAAVLAGQTIPGCESKLVSLTSGSNAAADFTLFTYTPIAGHINGFILDDTANEYDPTSPQFGEKFAPPWLPIAIRDWTGRMISSTYSDEYGAYNALVPSTYTANLPQPSGMSPNMLTTCMNDPEADTIGGFYNNQYSTFCYTFDYMPGTTTYLDTPVIPVAAFAGQNTFPLDCEFPDGTPRIQVVSSSDAPGPYLATDSGTLTLTSTGTINVLNPAYDGVASMEPLLIPRDYGFGATQGTVTLGGTPLTVDSWTDATIQVSVPGGVSTGQLVVTRDNTISSITGITVQIGLRFRATLRTVSAGQSIQAAIDAARPNDLILVGPGTYPEMLIMWKPVQLQGSGEGTLISAIKAPAEKLIAWQQKTNEVSAFYDLVDGQGAGPGGGVDPGALFSEEGAGVLVLATSNPLSLYSFLNPRNQDARIDGFTITGADTAGAIVANGFADSLNISNNRIIGNNGFFGGGIRLGHPELIFEDAFSDAGNDNIDIANNYISRNGGFSGAGGGVSLCNGSDNYLVSGNFICGNFTQQDGAGIAHLGLSTNGVIADNTIIFNENFNQGVTINGGGISIAGNAPLGCPIDPLTGLPDPLCLVDLTTALTPGSGSVQILRNLIQGNAAGVGDGGGIRLSRINGHDVDANLLTPANWYTVDIINNMIFNNVAALAGAGISIQDALRARVLYNSIANNDNTSTGAEAFIPGSPNESDPQPGAGIVSRAHTIELSTYLDANLPGVEDPFSNPEITNNILWNNRQFYFLVDTTTTPGTTLVGLCPDINDSVGLTCSGGNAPVYSDVSVLPTGSGTLLPLSADNIVTGGADPGFVAEYTNGSRISINLPESTTGIGAPPAFDEGGNFIRLRYGPLSQTNPATGNPFGDLHLLSTNDNATVIADVTDDFDQDLRSGTPDIGADEL